MILKKKKLYIPDMELKNVRDILCGINHILFYLEANN